MSNGRERQADAARRVAEALAVPLLTFLGARPENPTDPTAGLSLVVTERALNAAGMLHGGVIATMLDLAAYLTVLPTLDPPQQAVTQAFSTSYLSPSAAGETVVARGSLLRRSRHLAFVSVTLTCADGLVAVASVIKSIIERAPADAADPNR